MQKIFFIVIGVIVLGLIGFGIYSSSKGPVAGKYDTLAKCIADSGVKFYGAFWCPHCKEQKLLFGSAVQYLPYVECSTPNGKEQLEICKEAKIEGYPTWIYNKTISFASKTEPKFCDPTNPSTNDPACAGRGSKTFPSYLFDDLTVSSETKPEVKDGIYTFPANTRTGITSLERLAEINKCVLPN